MNKDIHDLAYLISQAKENNEPKPIVLLGAGASVSGGIPLASGIIKRILKEYKNKPSIKRLSKEKKSDYYELMSALTAKERRQLFQGYIREAKINIAHIYLAQLVKMGYVDYVLTVNFDDLLLRACGLFNYTMPTYDISNVNEFTTTTFQEQSIVYLHGQHYGEWLLNAEGELEKVKDKIPLLLNKICHNRTWIVAGYSGADEVFDVINNFSSFDNELYWVSYLNNKPADKVQSELLDVMTKNAKVITGYDADTFFLDLHAKLDVETPEIFNKPFSFLKKMVNEVEVPEEDKMLDDHKDLYIGLKERINISNEWVDTAIEDIQENDSVENFKQQIIEAYVKEEFEENESFFLSKIKQKGFEEAKFELSNFYFSWGDQKLYLADQRKDKAIYLESFEKYKKAVDLDLTYWGVFNNWGVAILRLADLLNDKIFYKESVEKFEKVIKLNSESEIAYHNLGNAIAKIAMLEFDENLFKESFKKYEKSIELNPKYWDVYESWVASILNYTRSFKDLSKKQVQEKLIEAKNKAIIFYKNTGDSYNLSCVFAVLKDTKNALKYLKEALEKKNVLSELVFKDKDWGAYLEDESFLKLIESYK